MTRFLRLWAILGFAYLFGGLLYNLMFLNRVDLTPVWFGQMVVVSFVQALAYWLVAARRPAAGDDGSGRG